VHKLKERACNNSRKEKNLLGGWAIAAVFTWPHLVVGPWMQILQQGKSDVMTCSSTSIICQAESTSCVAQFPNPKITNQSTATKYKA